MSDHTGISMAFANELIDLGAAQLSEADVDQLKRLTLDYAAVTLCGAAQPWGRKLRAWACEQGVSGKARLIGAGDGVPAATAGLANGTAARSLA